MSYLYKFIIHKITIPYFAILWTFIAHTEAILIHYDSNSHIQFGLITINCIELPDFLLPVHLYRVLHDTI